MALDDDAAALTEGGVETTVGSVGEEDAGGSTDPPFVFIASAGGEDRAIWCDGEVMDLGAARTFRPLADDAGGAEALIKRAVGGIAGEERGEGVRPADAFLRVARDHDLAV